MNLPATVAEVGAPWPNQPIVWFEVQGEESWLDRREAMQAQVSDGFSHIVREVRLRESPRHVAAPCSLEGIEALLEQTNNEFQLLRAAGISVAPTEWYTFQAEGTPHYRTLARVAVVEGYGIEPVWAKASPEERVMMQDCGRKIKAYTKNRPHHSRSPLRDIGRIDQYIFGRLRGAARPSVPALHLVDIEPIY